ncbi:translation initiation factor IF-5A [Candidatus Pacearchaeota archaeon]|nr:translation initiation factor IF-5A [Candidatus Pacearchaeota archaeon]
MVLKLIQATSAKSGTTVLWNGIPCVVRSNDQSKTGKHGSMKCRMEVVGIFDKKKRIGVIPGGENLEVPVVEKRRAQILTVDGDIVSVMDLENFETLNLPYDDDLKGNLAPEQQVEYWDIEGQKVIMRSSS